MEIKSDSNRVALSYVEENTQSTIPTNPIFKKFRYKGSSDLKFEYKTEMSKEIIADRQVSDLYLIGAEASGGANIQYSIDSYDDISEGALFNRWVKNNIRNDTQAVLKFASVESSTGTTGKIHFDPTVSTAPFLDNDIVYVEGVTDFSGAIVQITGGTFSSPDYFHDFTVLNGVSTVTENATQKSRVYRCGYEFQDKLQALTSPNTLTSSTTDMTTLGFTVGQWIRVSSETNSATDGFDVTADNDFVRISAISTNILTLDKVPSGWAEDLNAGTKKIALFYDGYLQNGSTEISYTLERAYTDHSPAEYEYFSGMVVDEFSISNEKQSITTGAVKFIGTSSKYQTGRESGASSVDTFTTTPFNTVNNINYLELNDVDISGGSATSGLNLALKVDLNIKNNVRGQNAIGSLGFVGTGVGQFNVSGSIETYFQDSSILNLLSNNTDTSLRVRYNTGSRYQVIDLPRIKISSGSPEVTGVNEDVNATYGFQALKDITKGYTMSMSKVTTY